MYKLILENEYGNTLNFGMGSPYTISEIEGLSPPNANINLSETALIDGQRYNSSKVEIRTINIAFAIEYSAEKNRLNVYDILHVKKPVTVYYKSDLRDVFIEGCVSKLDVTHFEMKQIVTIEIVCPAPYFKSAQEVVNELSTIINSFHFPFFGTTAPDNIVFGYIQKQSNVTVKNSGEINVGMIITLYARGEVSNPKIFNYETGDFIGLNYTMQTADLITINTMAGEKTVTLLRNGERYNIFNNVMKNSKWLQLEGNESVFVYEVESGLASDLDVAFKHYDLYEGV